MKAKVILVLVGMGAIGGLMYGINRLSTRFHPYGNWILLTVVGVGVAIVIAWVWQEYDDDERKG
jgi:hypothetical protein